MKIINKYNNRGIIITSLPRSGSTYLAYLARLTIPGNISRILKEERWKDKELTEIYKKYYNENLKNEKLFLSNKIAPYQNYVVKNFATHYEKYENIIPGSYNIFLIRKNIFNFILSSIYSNLTGIYRFENKKYNSIYIKNEVFKDTLSFKLKQIDKLLNNEKNIKYDMIVEYEDFNNNLDLDLNMLNFSKKRSLDAGFQKAPNIKDRVKNYEELKIFFNSLKNSLKINNGNIKDGYLIDYNIKNN